MNTDADEPGEDESNLGSGDDRFDDAIRGMAAYRLPEEVKRRHLALLASLPDKQRLSRMARVMIVAGGVALFAAAGLGTAAALGVFSAPVTDRSIAHCYANADPNGAANHFDVTVADRPGAAISEQDAAAIALTICRGAWQQGRLTTTVPYLRDEPQPGPWTDPAPRLIACVLDDGQVAIFPGDTATCQQMNLPIAEQ